MLGLSYSWLDQRIRNSEFIRPDRTVVQPLRTPGGYRRFTVEMIKDIALSSHGHGWFSMDKLKSVLTEIATAAYRDTDGYGIPN